MESWIRININKVMFIVSDKMEEDVESKPEVEEEESEEESNARLEL